MYGTVVWFPFGRHGQIMKGLHYSVSEGHLHSWTSGNCLILTYCFVFTVSLLELICRIINAVLDLYLAISDPFSSQTLAEMSSLLVMLLFRFVNLHDILLLLILFALLIYLSVSHRIVCQIHSVVCVS